MNEKAKEILKKVFVSYSDGEDICVLKMPQGSQIHDFNMALKELTEKGFITINKKNLCNAEIILTDLGLEFCMDLY